MLDTTLITDYQLAIEQLTEAIDPDNIETLAELDTLESRLLDNFRREGLFGSEESIRHERAMIIHSLNLLSRQSTRQSFDGFTLFEDDTTVSSIMLPPFTFVAETSPNFQGRIAELTWLNEQFSQVILQKNSRTVLIRGQVGIGKSRLINTFGINLINDERSYIVIREFGEEFTPDQMIAQLVVDVFCQYRDLSSN